MYVWGYTVIPVYLCERYRCEYLYNHMSTWRWNTWLRTKHQLSIRDLTSWDHPTCPLAPLWLPTILRSSHAGLFGVSHPIRPLPAADQLYALSQWCSIYSAIHNTNPTHSLKFPLTFRNKMLNSLVLPNYGVCVFTVPFGLSFQYIFATGYGLSGDIYLFLCPHQIIWSMIQNKCSAQVGWVKDLSLSLLGVDGRDGQRPPAKRSNIRGNLWFCHCAF